MSGRITAASRRRMEARGHFVNLTPGPYLTIEDRISGEPRINLDITGHRQDHRLAQEIFEVLEAHFKHNSSLKLVTRKTA